MLNAIGWSFAAGRRCLGWIVLLLLLHGCGGSSNLRPWHTEFLSEEFTAGLLGDEVRSFDDYLALEARLFDQLNEQIYAVTERGPAHALERYSAGSAADPGRWDKNWNRSFELSHPSAIGGILLLHGMSDSPYSLRALGEVLNRRGYHVVGLRLPGHGTAPSGLRRVTWQDMAAAVELGMRHLAATVGPKPLHMIGYSNGAPLALNHALDGLEDAGLPMPASVVLISPAIRVHPAGGLAAFKNALSALPGLGGLAYLQVMDEFDPYKYNSFATNAASQVHLLTSHVGRRIAALSRDAIAAGRLPPILVLKSTVDATVTTEAVVTDVLMRLPPHRNELVLFDINRNAAIQATLLVDDPGPLTDRLMADRTLPFAVTFLTNENPYSTRVVAKYKPPFAAERADAQALDLVWPRGVVSLSHVALPFPPDDPLYGQQTPESSERVFLGDLAIKGERGVLRIPENFLLRLRYNPFYGYMETRILRWLDETGAQAIGRTVVPGALPSQPERP
jgi:alpha-beta hydrolase superfamily lysophospholipase